VTLSDAETLLRRADAEPDRVQRHLLVAAALGLVLSHPPIVVGGTADEYWTQAEYHPTDLDVCAALTEADRTTLRDIGFEWTGMHWVRDRGRAIAVQFPDSRIDGDEARVATKQFGTAVARIISLEDLYLDRLRQATSNQNDRSIEFMSALAVVGSLRGDRLGLRPRTLGRDLRDRAGPGRGHAPDRPPPPAARAQETLSPG
jgi:hypothetical protein